MTILRVTPNNNRSRTIPPSKGRGATPLPHRLSGELRGGMNVEWIKVGIVYLLDVGIASRMMAVVIIHVAGIIWMDAVIKVIQRGQYQLRCIRICTVSTLRWSTDGGGGK